MSATEPDTSDILSRSAAGRFNPWLVAVVASMATFMEVLDTTIASVSLYHIAADMGVSWQESLWVISSYLIANALILPVSGWLATVLGRKRYYMISVALFTFSSLLCSMATSLEFLIAARILQGIGGGGLAPVEQSMLVDSFPRKKLPQAFALYGVIILVAPAIGPLPGGWLTETLSWQWVFLINVPIGLLSLLLCHYFISEPPLLEEERRAYLKRGIRIDYLGFLLVIVGFGSLQLFLDSFGIHASFDAPFTGIMAALAIVSLSFLLLWEWFHPEPVMEVRLFLQRNFALGTVLMFLVGFLVISTTQLMPQMAQELFGFDAWHAGLMLGAGGLSILLFMLLTGGIAGRLNAPHYLIMAGFAAMGAAMLHLSSLTLTTDFTGLMWARVMQVSGLPLILISVGTLSYHGLPESKSNQAAALSTLMRNIGGSIGIVWTASVLHQRTYFHYERLGEHITTATLTPQMPLQFTARLLYIEARLMSYLDIYFFMALLIVLVIPLPFWFVRTRTIQ